jgi:L-ascorbate metabolism protein UlaG (beta-lactamase superfamily)
MTEGSPAAGRVPAPPAVTWVGHATALLELDGVRLLTDPVLRDRMGPLTRIAAPASPAASEGIDAVLLSHLHADHADLPSLRRVGASTPIVAPRGAARWLGRHGLRDVHELSPGGQTHIGAVRVTATPARHGGSRWPLGAEVEPLGFVARGSRSCYFAGDTDLFAAMSELAGQIDLALLPVWGWGPKLGPGHLDPQRAAEAARLIAPKVAVPIHWGTFTLGFPARRPADPWRPARAFSALTAREAPAVEVRVLAPGERTELPADATPAG